MKSKIRNLSANPIVDVALFVVVSLAVRGAYLFLFSSCHAFDVYAWNVVADTLMAGKNPYHETELLNYPPFWMQLLFLFKKISLSCHVSFNSVLRGFLILVETGLGGLLYMTLARFSGFRRAGWLVITGIALNPICVFQVCQQCHFDVLVGLWMLLAIYLLLRFQEQPESQYWLGACFALGMGAQAKIIPLCLAPLLLVSVRRLKPLERVLGLALVFVPVVLTLSAIYVLTPGDIEAKVLGYRSIPGTFGFTGLFNYFGWNFLLSWWSKIFVLVYGGGWLWLGWWLGKRERISPEALVSLAIVMLLAIPAIGPGYSPQYVYWFLPLFVLLYGLSGGRARMMILLLYGVTTATYLVVYGFNYKTFGAFFLEIIQTHSLLEFGRRIATRTGETCVSLPLWVCYLAACIWLGVNAARKLGPERPS